MDLKHSTELLPALVVVGTIGAGVVAVAWYLVVRWDRRR